MYVLLAQLDDDLAHQILIAVGHFKRKLNTNKTVSSDYARHLRKRAAQHLFEWKTNGVSTDIYATLQRLSPGIILKFWLREREAMNSNEIAGPSQDHSSPDHLVFVTVI